MELAAFALWCFAVAAAGAATIGHVRARRVNWSLFAWMAPPSIAGPVLGGYLAGLIDEDVLLGRLSELALVRAIAVVLLVAAAAMVAQALV